MPFIIVWSFQQNNKEIREFSMQEKKAQYPATEDLQGFRSMLNSNSSV